MTYLSLSIMSASVLDESLERAKAYVSALLLPQDIDRSVIRRYFRRALRNKAWSRLSREARALLYLASRIVDRVKSRLLRGALLNIFLEIELAVARGRALLVAVAHLLSKGLKPLKNSLGKLVVMGLNILNHPLLAPRV